MICLLARFTPPSRLAAACAPLALAGLSLARPGAALAADPVSDDVEIEVEADAPTAPLPPTQPAVVPPAAPAPIEDHTAELQAKLVALEARLAALETAPPPPPPKRSAADVLGLKFSGYVQPQLVFSQLSNDELTSDGDSLNYDSFVVRRARFAVTRDLRPKPWLGAGMNIELDANTVDGPPLSVRRAEGALSLYGKTDGKPALATLLAGLSNLPFGYEIQQGNRNRLFMERTAASRAFFPGEPDIGARLLGTLGPVVYDIGVVNGAPFSDSPSADTTDYTASKTLVGRVGMQAGKADAYSLSGGVSFLTGEGFHEGTPATKSSLLWTDTNQNGVVSLDELQAQNGQAATPSSTFDRWGVNGDVEAGLHTPLGWTRVQVEATMASNLDRGYFVADPVSTGYNLRELGWNVAASQDITKWGIVGFRADSYNPNVDYTESRRGLFLPTNASILTLSPVGGVRLAFEGADARLVLQYDYIVDFLAIDVRGEPIDLPNDQWTLRLQGGF